MKTMFDSNKKSFDVENERYQMLFSFDNVYGIFRSANGANEYNSQNYELIRFLYHTSLAPDDVLKDIIYMIRAGEFFLNINDVICIKINGAFSSFRYLGMKYQDIEYASKNFIEVQKFLVDELQRYILTLHQENRVLSVLDGRTYSIDDFDGKTNILYCIDNETFRSSERAITSDYFLYVLKNSDIKVSNPYPRPFISIKHALYYFYKYRNKNTNAILLFNRYELEMVKDHSELKSLVI